MPRLAGQETLDKGRCACGEVACNTPMTMSAKCCGTELCKVSYYQGELLVECGKCSKTIVTIAVAEHDVVRFSDSILKGGQRAH